MNDVQVLRPGDDGYDDARTVWNAIVDHRPAAIVQPVTVADLQAAVRIGRENDLELGIKGGGHSAVGHCVPDGGLMLDLRNLNKVTVDPATKRARVQGGALLGALDRATQQYGLAVTAGNVSHTGVGGLTLGGGFGWLARRYGLACDNVESFEVVTADAKVVRAAADENPDLYWGLRGGGGNFGIVTEFEFRLHETGTRSLTVEIDFPFEQGVEVMRGWRDLLIAAPREATLTADIGPTGDITVGYVWAGDPDQDAESAAALVPQLRSLGTSVAERILDRSYIELQATGDVAHAHSRRRYAKSHYLTTFPDDAIEAFLRRGTPDGRSGSDVPLPNAGLQAYGGAISDIPEPETAFSHRRTLVEYSAGLRWDDPGQDADLIGSAAAPPPCSTRSPVASTSIP